MCVLKKTKPIYSKNTAEYDRNCSNVHVLYITVSYNFHKNSLFKEGDLFDALFFPKAFLNRYVGTSFITLYFTVTCTFIFKVVKHISYYGVKLLQKLIEGYMHKFRVNYKIRLTVCVPGYLGNTWVSQYECR